MYLAIYCAKRGLRHRAGRHPEHDQTPQAPGYRSRPVGEHEKPVGFSVEPEAERSVTRNLQERGREPDYREQYGPYPGESGRYAFGSDNEQKGGGERFEEHRGTDDPGG